MRRHAHAGVLLLLSLVILQYVDNANLLRGVKAFIRHSAPLSAILLPVAYFLSILSPTSTQPNGLINLAYLGAAIVALGLLELDIGLLKRRRSGCAEGPPRGPRRQDGHEDVWILWPFRWRRNG